MWPCQTQRYSQKNLCLYIYNSMLWLQLSVVLLALWEKETSPTLSMSARTVSSVNNSPGNGHSSTFNIGTLWHMDFVCLLKEQAGPQRHTTIRNSKVAVFNKGSVVPLCCKTFPGSAWFILLYWTYEVDVLQQTLGRRWHTSPQKCYNAS